jgi:hypothetical protein
MRSAKTSKRHLRSSFLHQPGHGQDIALFIQRALLLLARF